MHVVCETNEWYKKYMIDKENNVMPVNPITNDKWKDWSIKNLKNWNFQVSISRKESKNFSINQALIESSKEYWPKN